MKIRNGVLAVLAVLSACSGSEAATVTPDLAAPVATSVVETAVTPTPTLAPQTPAIVDPNVTVLWFPREPESFDDFTAMFPVERSIPVDGFDNDSDRLTAILAAWAAGPAAQEVDDGFISPLSYFEANGGCAESVDVEIIDGFAVAAFCGQTASAGVGEDARRVSSFSATMTEAGFPDAALLNAERDRCIGNLSDEPLSCLPVELGARLNGGGLCPVGSDPILAEVVGVETWANTRSAASLDAFEVQRIDAGTVVPVYVQSRRSDFVQYSWVAVALPDAPQGRSHCAWMAAQLLEVGGTTLDTIMPGVDYSLPAGEWTVTARAWGLDEVAWALDDSFATSIGIQVEAAQSIDELIEARLKLYEDGGYEYPEDWFEEREVEGADRAVRPITFVGESGDGAESEIWIQVGDRTIVGRSYVYIEDLSVAPLDEIDDFINSMTINRDLFDSIWG